MADPYYNDNFALLHCDGANNSSTFTDSGPTNILGIGSFGGTPLIKTAESKWGGASLGVTGSDILAIDAFTSSITALAIQTGDFTLEMWARATTIDGDHILIVDGVGTTYSAKLWIENATDQLRFTCRDSGGSIIIDLASTATLTTGVWYHVAGVRDGSTFRLFLDGTQEATDTDASSLYDTSGLGYVQIGGDGVGDGFKGYLDDIRITEGIARYTASFTAPTAAFEDVYGPGSTTLYPASLGVITAFGTPEAPVGLVTSSAPSTALGTPTAQLVVGASSVGPFTTFGTGAYSDDRSTTATGFAADTTFGLAWAERDPLPGTPTTIASAPSTAFGTPTVNGSAAVTAAGASTTAFGTPVSGWVCPVTGFAVGTFGTPVLSNPVRATSVLPATAFGLGMTAGFGSTTGAAPSTAFGLPVATAGAVGGTTGATSTAFGTPSTLNNRQRTRSGVFRTQWGLAQAERTAP